MSTINQRAAFAYVAIEENKLLKQKATKSKVSNKKKPVKRKQSR